MSEKKQNKLYTEEELFYHMSMAFHYGVDAGEKGIPEDFVSYNPEHMVWYCEKSLEAMDEIKKYLEDDKTSNSNKNQVSRRRRWDERY